MGMFALDHKTTQILHEKTEGWIVGLRLASMGIKNQNDLNHFLQNLKGDIHLVSEFLIEEVLASQPTEIQELLFRTSILNRFSASLINDINRTPLHTNKTTLDGDKFIRNLINSNLFVISLDNTNQWFRYHHQFKDLIKKQLEQKYSQDEINKWHVLAATWFEKNNLTNEAFDHFILAQDYDNAARVIQENVQLYESEKKWHIIQKMIDRLPDSIIHEQAGLLLIQAQIYFYQLNMGLIPPLLDRIDSLKKAGANVQKLYGKVSLFKGFVAFYSGNGKVSLENFKYAFKHLPEDDIGLIATAELYIALSNQMIGNYEISIKHSIKRLEKLATLHPLVEIYVNWALIQPQIIHGDFDSASKYLIRQHTISKTSKLDYVISWCHYLDGLVRLLNGKIDEAIELLEFTSEKKYLSYPRSALDAMALLVYAYLFKGQTVKATESLQSLNEFVAYLGPFYQPIADSVNSQFAIINGDSKKGTKWLKTIQIPMGEVMIFWYEIPCISWCRVLITEGLEANLKEAQLQLQAYAQQNEKQNNRFQLIRIKVLQALAFEKQKDTENALSKINEALSLASPGNILFPFLNTDSIVHKLLQKLYSQGIEVDFLEKIFSLQAATKQSNIENEKINNLSLNKEKSIYSNELISELSPREQDILVHVSSGLRNKEIADKLYVSTDTIKKHLYNTFQKLHVSNRLELVNKAKSMGLIEK
jgi:LuxR family maltose regulon positive regulatory protein